MRTIYQFVTTLLAISSVTCTEECYYPDGTAAPGLVPCREGVEVSHCCRDADTCLTNGLCFSSGLGSILRRGCTDKGWNSTQCPNICTNDSQQSDAVLTPCGEYGSFCCGQDDGARACCESGNGTIKIGGGEAMCNGTTTVFVTPSAATVTAEPTTCPLNEPVLNEIRSREKAKGSAMIALAVLWGCTLIVLAVSAWYWRQELDKLKNKVDELENPQFPMGHVRERQEAVVSMRERIRGAGGAQVMGIDGVPASGSLTQQPN